MKATGRLTVLSLAAGGFAFLTASAFADPDDRSLIAQVAADRPSAVDAAPRAGDPADALDEQEQKARAALTLSRANLELVLARKDMRARRFTDAASRAQSVLELLRELPPAVDADDLALQAEGILARAERQGVDLSAVTPARTAQAEDSSLIEDRLDVQARAAEQVVRRYIGADTQDIDTTVDARTLKQRALSRQVPDEYGYRPGREIFDVDAILERDRQRLAYEYALRKAYTADEVRRLTQADEARITPERYIAYPDDWPQRVARRKQFEGGQIARSDSRVDATGREWYAAVYDIHDLIYQPPDFQPPFELHPSEALRVALDRNALRWRSMIFSGYAEDLAAGLPLLRYFGGIDDYFFRGPKYSLERQRQIVEMIHAFTEDGDEPRILSLPPTNP